MKLRVAGHPLHPALVHFPLAFWFATVVWDVVGWWRPDPLWAQLAYWCLVFGLTTAVPAVVTGFIELVSMREPRAVLNIATAHMMAMFTATFAFGGSFILRMSSPAEPSLWATRLALAGALALAIGGWLGGTLVYRYGVGVDTETHE